MIKKTLSSILILVFIGAPSAVAEGETSETKGWYLYNNHAGSHSYSLLFPPDWKVKTFGTDERGFLPERRGDEAPHIKVKDFMGIGFNEVITHFKTPEVSFLEQYDFLFETEKEDLVAKKAYFAEKTTGKTIKKTMIKRGDQIIVISVKKGDSELEEEIKEKIIRTFVFTDNWEAHINFNEKYTFITPDNYTVEETANGLIVKNVAGNKVIEVEGDEMRDLGRTYITNVIMESVQFFDIPVHSEYPYQNFLDVRDNHENAHAINLLTEKGILGGYKDGTFKPDDPVNRAELMKMIIPPVMSFALNPNVFKNCFPDVEDEWFARYVCYSKAMGWVDGYEDETFRPGDPVNRAEAMKIILESSRKTISPYEVLQFDNVADVAEEDWYSHYFIYADNRNLLDKQHVVRDKDKYKFLPAENMTRKEVAEMIFRTRYR